jgi:zona occludens toxin (predicted ATPase)
MRKLTSFNQPEESSRKEKEDALTEYLHEEYDIVLGSQQISEIFHLIEKNNFQHYNKTPNYEG